MKKSADFLVFHLGSSGKLEDIRESPKELENILLEFTDLGQS